MQPVDPLSLVPDGPVWPREFEKSRCPDAAFAEAWERLPKSFRAAIKNAIALHAFHFGETSSRQLQARCDLSRGFAEKNHEKPVPWALVIFEAAFRAPALLAEACVLPALCGVPQIGAICTGGTPLPQNLTALELCGLEDLFLLQEEDVAAALANLPAGGCVTFLGSSENSRFSPNCPGLRVHVETRRPELFVRDPQKFNLEALVLAHGFSLEELLAPKSHPLDGLFVDRPLPEGGFLEQSCLEEFSTGRASASPRARLVLGPGLEAFWLLENYGPEFFQSREFSFFWLPAQQNCRP